MSFGKTNSNRMGLWLALAFGLAACGGSSGGHGSGGGEFSCDVTTGQAHSCTEYSATGGYSTAAAKNACVSAGGVAGSGCNQSNSVGGCRIDTTASGVTLSTTTWYYASTTASEIMQGCPLSNGTYVAAGGGGGNGGGGNDGGGGGGDSTPGVCGGNMQLQLVTDSLILPTMSTPFQYDFDGSSKPRNLFGTLLMLLGTGSAQAAVDQAVQDGSSTIRFAFKGDNFTSDACATLVVTNVADESSELDGAIQNSGFSSAATATAGTPTELTLLLPLLGSEPIAIPLTAVHVTAGYIDTAGNTISGGAINGAIKNSDLHDSVYPALAKSFTAQIAPGSKTPAQQQEGIKNLFDLGCGANQDGAHDGEISTCELSSGLLSQVLAPDLDLFADATTDASGNSIGSYAQYHPTPANANATSAQNRAKADSISFGIGFTAVSASF